MFVFYLIVSFQLYIFKSNNKCNSCLSPWKIVVPFDSSLNTLIILLQHPFQVRSLVEYLPCKLRVGDDFSVAVVLQGTGTDIQPLAHFLAREEKFASKEWLVCLYHFHDPFPHTSQCRDDQLHLVRLHVQISCSFHHICTRVRVKKVLLKVGNLVSFL